MKNKKLIYWGIAIVGAILLYRWYMKNKATNGGTPTTTGNGGNGTATGDAGTSRKGTDSTLIGNGGGVFGKWVCEGRVNESGYCDRPLVWHPEL